MSKRNLFASFAAIVLCFLASSCVKNSELEGKVKDIVQLDSLNARISAIESQLKQINGNIASLQTIVNALNKNVYVTKVETLEEGCKLIFSDGTSVTRRYRCIPPGCR